MKVKVLIYIFVLFSFAFSSFNVFAVWDVSPGQTVYEYSPGETFTVDVMINGDGNDIDALGFDFHFPGLLLDYVDVTYTGTFLENWMFKDVSELDANTLRIAGFTTTNIIPSGSVGILIKINFIVEAGAAGEGAIFFDGFTDDLAGATDGQATFRVPSAGFSVSGLIDYYSNANPVENATLTLASATEFTDVSGLFSFTNIPGGTCTLGTKKLGDIGSGVSAFDAAKILQFAAGMITLTPYQMIAADVSGNGGVSPFDASYVLRLVAGLITAFPVGSDWVFVPTSYTINETNWSSAPDSILYDPLAANMTDQNFKGIVYGDVSGNWSSPNLAGGVSTVELMVDAAQNLDHEFLNIPVKIKMEEQAYSGHLKLNYNNTDFEFVSSSLESEESSVIYVNSKNRDQIACVFASPNSLKDKQLVINLMFKNLHPGKVSSPELNPVEFAIDEKNTITNFQNNQDFAEIPARYTLSQNYPNPFNPETMINYQLSEDSHIVIEIYNQLGQKIRTLVNTVKTAGNYDICWNGFDDSGNEVVSGVYFYKMRAGDFISTKKMALIR